MKIHRSPTKKEVKEIQKLIELYAEKEAEAENLMNEIDSIFGGIIFGKNSATNFISEGGEFKRFVSECGRFALPFTFSSENLSKYKEIERDLLDAFIGVEGSPIVIEMNERWFISKACSESKYNALMSLLSMAAKIETPRKFDYQSDEFRKLRHMVFIRDGERCAKCGAKHSYNNWLEIDHIKPVSKYPTLGMDIDNLQVLCRNCNRLKSNIDETDYRGAVICR